MAKVNGEEYAFADVELVIGQTSVTGFEAVSYTETQEKTNVIGKGDRPVARGRGTRNAEGSITLHQSEVRALLASAGPGKGLLDLKPFEVAVTYGSDPATAVSDRLGYCEFTEQAMALAVGDNYMAVELPLIIGNIEYGI